MQITLLVFVFRYRYDPNRRATYTHGNTTLEIAWTVAPALMLAMLAIMSRTTWADIKWRQPPSDFNVIVTAKQFNWEIAYPGPDGKLETEDDVILDNDLHVPVNKTVRIALRSRDVIHSFFVPNFRLKQDAVPGRNIPVWFKATQDRQVRAAVRRALRLRPLRHEGLGLRPRPGRVRGLGAREEGRTARHHAGQHRLSPRNRAATAQSEAWSPE